MSLTEDHIKSINKGDMKAFREMYNEMYHSLCLYGYKMYSEQDIVADVVQEAFIILWNKRGEFTSLLGTKSYLYATVRNKIITHIKSSKTVSIEENPVEDLQFDNQITKEETFKMLREAVAQLPEQTRKVVELTLNGHTNPEIAEAMGISVNSVKTLKKHGYAKLREMLKDNIFLLILLADIFGK